MFGKLKDKLKSALNVFSTKTQEEAQDLPPEQAQKVLEEQQEEQVEEVKEEPKVEESEQKPQYPKEEEQAHKAIEEANKTKGQEVPTSFSVPKAKYEPDPEKIQELKQEQDQSLPTAHDIISEAKQVYQKKEQDRLARQKKKQEQFAERLVEDSFPKEEVKKEEPQVEVVEKKEPVKEEKQGFFGKLFKRKKEEPKEESDDIPIEEVERVISGESKVEERKVEVKEAKKAEIKEEIKPEIKEEAKEKEPQEEPKSFFGKIKRSLTTKTISQEKFEELFWELELVLLENNVSLQVIEKIKDDLKVELVDKPLPRDILSVINETLQTTLREILTHEPVNLIELSNNKKPLIIAFFGINGAGKTTSIAKLTNYFKKNGKSVVLAACDTFRAAAIQQLEEHANNLNTKMIKHNYGSDAAAVAFDAVQYAQKNDVDVVLIDTAGRLHSNTNLMAELEKIIRVTKPDLKIFIGESITGNDCVEQATKFNELVQMDGAILTKADVDEKGGAPLSISYVIGKPILFLGVGQEYDDFEEFDVEKMLKRVGF